MSSVTGVMEELRSQAMGTYTTNNAIIRIKKDYSFWNPDIEHPPATLALFAHEYLHYLHNFSTIAGIYGFVCHLRIAKLFRGTVGEDGLSIGAAALSADEGVELKHLLAWRSHLFGSHTLVGSDLSQRPDTVFDIKSISTRTEHCDLKPLGIELRTPIVEVNFRRGQDHSEHHQIVLGSLAVMESVAWETEKSIFELRKEPIFQYEAMMPAYPYKLPRAIFEHLSGEKPSSNFLSRIGVLSLQTSDPGQEFIGIAQRAGTLLKEMDEDAALTQLTNEVMTPFRVRAQDICTFLLVPEFSIYDRLGIVGQGATDLSTKCAQYIHLRTESPFFELDALELATDSDSLRKLLISHPPCPIMHISNDKEPLELFYISETDLSEIELGKLGSLQAYLEFLNMHFVNHGFADTKTIKKGKCLFFGVCRHSLSKSRPEICKTAPWESISCIKPHGACWFAHGVAAARGLDTATHQSWGTRQIQRLSNSLKMGRWWPPSFLRKVGRTTR